VVAVGAALSCVSPALADALRDDDASALAPGDRIAVTVVGQPELSGEITVDGSGNIVLPFTGPIRVEDLTVVACQQLIRDRLADGFLQQPVVSVRISEPRPLYVLGDVRAPGAYPYRYGSTVKSAVALAGGFGTAGPPQSSAVSEFLSADERVRQLTYEQAALLVRQARLEAQHDGRDMFSPPDLSAAMNEKQLTELVASEKKALAAQATILKTQTELLNNQKPRLAKEISAINGQIGTAKDRVDFVKSEVKRSTDLVTRGLGVHGSQVQLKIQEANEESNLWRLVAQLSRLQRDIGDLDIKIEEANASFSKQTLAELDKVRQRLSEVNIALPSGRQIRDLKLQQAGNAAEVQVARMIDITRTRHGQVSVFQGSETTPLQPGDVVDIKTMLPGQHHRSGTRPANPGA